MISFPSKLASDIIDDEEVEREEKRRESERGTEGGEMTQILGN
jgi:hypothetical protein